MKIGITERGDAALDLSWEQKLKHLEFAILITKDPGNSRFIEAVARNRNKVMVHATITGFGGYPIEPNVRPWQDSIKSLDELHEILGYDGKVVLRVDPIIPSIRGLALAREVMECGINEFGVSRIRYSFLDMYPHVRERFFGAKIRDPYGGSFNAPDEMIQDALKMLDSVSKNHLGCTLESCAEYTPHQRGCVSLRDSMLFGSTCSLRTCGQRKSCLCSSDKTELLSNRSQCKHGCLYCYWK